MTTPKTEVKLKIVTGGSREDVRDSVGSKKSFRLIMHFVVEIKSEHLATLIDDFGFQNIRTGELRLESVLNGMEWEDGSGESWNLKGWLKSASTSPNGLPFSAYYRTDRRTGVLSLVKYH